MHQIDSVPTPRFSNLKLALTTTQRRVYDELLEGMSAGSVSVLRAPAGMGKTTVLHELQEIAGGAYVTARRFMSLLSQRAPAAVEEAFLEMMDQSLATADIVFVDDLHLITSVVEGYDYPRAHLLNTALTAVLTEAQSCRQTVIFGVDGEYLPQPIKQRAYLWEMDEFVPEDYREICHSHIGGVAERLDYEKIHRFAPTLNGYQLKNACAWFHRRNQGLTTELFIEYLISRNMTSNIDLQEIEEVDWNDLKGVDEIIFELEAKIVLPFENDALASELNLRPKRGVLISGPPGTGKTTIGRALARKLKSKFFLIDGTVIAGTSDFYEKVQKIFENAKRNSPSIVFIDDADVIFEEGNRGLYRYLLTILDGLQSASSERVCVMMTAMDTSNLPQAILRSGRLELWLETRLPDQEARVAILLDKTADLPPPFSEADIDRIARASRGLTGADLKTVVEDAKLFFAHSRVTEEQAGPIESYFLKAIAAIRANRANYGRKAISLAGNRIGFRADQL